MTGTPVLVHGFAGSSTSWPSDLVCALETAGWNPTAIDLPGHGAQQDPTRQETFDLETVFSRIGRARAGALERGPLIGYSMGGRVALHYAVRHPDRVSHLILESSSPGLATEAERETRRLGDAELARRILEEGVESFVENWEVLPIFASQRRLTEEVREGQRRHRISNDAFRMAGALRGLGTGTLPSLWPALAGLDFPILLVVGEEDDKFVAIANRMDALLPSAHLVVVPDCGHAVHLEAPDVWAACVTDFLDHH
ncbi:MAG: 2-succinyl-6-hydroxy-2,4-cyclohexadiene-1-carboxylate synthase [Longimicrobiales bacterium]|nr:2-succinyl-6-hydroxy-2,4-cyclohexadiene-1-carboxylate synthase [Longimicrobiales bacterium]